MKLECIKVHLCDLFVQKLSHHDAKGGLMTEHPDIDIKENYIKCLDDELLSILLKDRSSGKNILWATDTYAEKGAQYDSWEHITVKLITGRFGKVIRPRIDKSQKEQKIRIKDKAEVFTPSWICNEMNNHLSDEWFEKKNVFNTEKEKTWTTSKNKIQFSNEDGKTWQDYVKSKVLEISCGEAPFLVSRYDTTTGEWIEVNDRIGALDRKLRVVNEQCDSEPDWYNWTLEAFKSTYGYEWQGDSLLIARENLLFTFIDYYIAKFENFPIKEYLIEIAKILSWNIWQMDGLKYVIPNSCKPTQKRQMSLFQDEEDTEPCAGCIKNDNSRHTGIYCKIMNWDTKRSIKFFKGEKRMKFDFVIGNPPYQEMNTSNKMSKSVYPDFVRGAKTIGRKVSLIMPARWTSGESGPYKETKGFIDEMIDGNHIKSFVLYPNSIDLFSNVDIKGGVCFYVYDEDYSKNEVDYTFVENGIKKRAKVSFREADNIIIRFPELISILRKSRNPFGFVSDLFVKNNEGVSRISETKISDDDYMVYGLLNAKRATRYIPNNELKKNLEGANNWKVFIPRANGSGAFGEVFSTPIIGTPMTVCTDTFLQVGQFKDKIQAENLLKYVKTKYFRAMVGIKKSAVFNYKDCFEFVPLQNFTNKSDIDWNKSIHDIDLQLYKKYNLSQEEINFIESHVKEMK